MRFMVLVKANADSEAGVMPSPELLQAMGKYNEELVKAGVLLAGEGLHASSKGARVKFSGKARTVTNGPFGQTNELLAGFWLIQVASMAEALEWASRIPFTDGEEVEIRQVSVPTLDPDIPFLSTMLLALRHNRLGPSWSRANPGHRA